MKRTYNINMGQRLFVIDEDAYNLMTEYLETLRHFFSSTPGQEETATDLEIRASELFTEYLAESGSPSISLEQVQEVITRLGKPEEMVQIEEDRINSPDLSGSESQTPPPYMEEVPIKKRLYRNPKDRVIGGLCSGLAAYLGVDVIWIRIIAIILAIGSASTVVIVYVVGCLLIPEAKTPLQRMQMFGEMPTLANIGKNMTDMVSDAYGSLRDQAADPESGLSKFMKSLGKILLVFFLGILGIIIIGCFIALIIMLGICLADVASAVFPSWHFAGSWSAVRMALSENSFISNSGTAFVLMSVIIPCGILEYVLYGLLTKRPAMKLRTFLSWLAVLLVTITASCLLLE